MAIWNPNGNKKTTSQTKMWTPPAKTGKKNVVTKNDKSSILDFYNQYSQAANKARTFGLSGALEKGLDTLYEKVTGKPSPAPKPKAPTTTGQKITAGVGEVVGSAIPIGGLYNVARQGVAKAIPTAVSLPAKIAKLSAPGAASVGAYEGITAATEGKSLKDIGKETAIGAAFGAGGELAGRAIGKGFGVLVSKMRSKPIANIQPLALPPGRQSLALPPSKVSGVIPEYPSSFGVIRQGGLNRTPSALPMGQAESVIKNQFKTPLLTGKIDSAIRTKTPTQRLSLPPNQYEKVLKGIATREGISVSEAIKSLKGIHSETKRELGKLFSDTSIPVVNRTTTEPLAELSAARTILKQTKNLDRAAKILNVYPSLKSEFKLLTKKIANRKPPKNITTKPTTIKNVPSVELQAAKNIIKTTNNPQRILAILNAYPELKTKAIINRIKQLQAKQKPKINNVSLNNDVPPIKQGTKGTADSFRSKINREPKKASKFSETIKKFQTEFVDDLNPLERLEKSVRGKVASAENSLYKTARLFRGVPTKSQEFIRSRLEPVIDSIEKSGYTYKDLGDYSLAIHARDVNAKGIVSGFTDDEIKAVLNKFSSLEMENARKQLVKVSDDLLNDLAASGVIDASMPAVLRQKWPNYMPLFRHFNDDKIEFARGLSSALANVTSPINKLVGSNRKVIDPIESMIKNIYQSINATERNKVAQQLGRLANEDTAGKFVRRLAPNEERGRLNTVYERVNGEKIYYEVDPEVYKAIMDLDKDSAGFLIKILQKPASLLRAGATLVPEFSFRNPIRDVVQAYVVSKSGFNPVVDFPVALFQIVFGGKKVPLTNYRLPDQLYRQWLADSGGYGNIVSTDRNLHREVLEKIIKEGSGKKFVNILNGKSLIRLLRSIADTTESATKVGEYRAAKNMGLSQQEAAYRSRDIMDFSRAGTSIRQANRIVAFLNANIQGKSKILRAIREDPKGVTVRAAKAVTMPSVGVYLAQKYLSSDKQKEIINDAPTWLKDTFWLLPIPGTDLVARIPKPFDLAPVFANIPERALRYIDGKDEKAFDEFAKETFSQLSIPVMLTGLAPFVEGMANYSFFRQGPIIPEREKDLNYPDQYDINTSETAKSIARGVNAVTGGEGALRNFGSPRVVENTIRGVTGGLGTYATNAVDVLLEGTGVINKADKPTRKISEKPVIKAFLVNENISGKSMSDLYDERERLTKAKGSAKANKEPFKEGTKLKKIENVTKAIGLLTKKIRTIEGDKKLSSDEKRKQIDVLVEKRNKLAKDTVSKLGI